MEIEAKSASSPPPLGLETMSEAMHEAENFHRWSHSWVAPYLQGRVLDIGGGTGNHLRFLECAELTSVDISEECVLALRRRFRGRPGWRFVVGDVASKETLSALGEGAFDTVFSSNVLEHIADDGAVLRGALRLLRRGGRLVLVLPAHEALYGRLDSFAGHHRRYSAPGLRGKLEVAGFAVEELRYVNMVGALGWLVNGRLLRPRGLSTGPINAQIRLFDRYAVPVLRRLEEALRPPFGQSLVAVGRRL